MKIFRAIAFFLCVLSSLFAAEKQKNVYVVPLEGQIDQAQFFIFRRAFQEAEKSKADAVIIKMDTPGGRLIETEEMISWMRGFKGRVISYVEKHGQSAGAILCLASDEIYMAPGSRVGSAAPILIGATGGVEQVPSAVQEKILSDARSLVRGLAQENGYPIDLAEAFVDQEVEFKLGEKVICPKGQLLNLTAQDAVGLEDENGKKVFAKAICKDLDEVIEKIGLKGAKVTIYKPTQAEELAKWITMMAPIFLIIGGIGLFIEFKTPGFGIPGIVGVVFLGLFFFGHHVAGLSGYEEVLLVVVGVILLMIEVFVIPGFGVVGVSGMLLITGGLIMAMVPSLPDFRDFYLTGALVNFAISGVGIAFLAWLLSKVLPNTSVFQKIVNAKEFDKEEGYVAFDKKSDLVGQQGKTVTPLHPTGVVIIENRRIDVVSDGDWIERDVEVKVVAVEGMRIVVEPVS